MKVKSFRGQCRSRCVYKTLRTIKNVDFEELKAVREQMQTLFHEFMKASQQTLQDDKKKVEFDVFIQETKERLQQFYK